VKNPKLRIKKKVKVPQIRKFKQDIKETVHACLLDIEKYIVDDVISMLKKKGIIYYAKKNKKKS